MYIEIAKAMVPYMYAPVSNGENRIVLELENFFLPVLGHFQGMKDNQSETKQDEMQVEESINTGDMGGENIQQDIPAVQGTDEIKQEKKVVIHRVKLQEFDYLRQNFYQVDNTTTVDGNLLNADAFLAKDMHIKNGVEGPQILIYHTHSQEGYVDSVPGDSSTSVVAVGDYLEQLLEEKYGVQVLHHKGQYDIENRSDAYAAARPEIERILKENPSIEVVIDLHRDGVPDNLHLVTEVNGKQTAQIMFFNGLSKTTSQGDLLYLANPYINDNLALSFQMQLAAMEYYPGFTRKIYLKGYRYNMHLCSKSMLIEVGAQTNTFEEAKNAMEPLADILGKVLITLDE